MLDLAIRSGTSARLSGDVTFSHVAPVGDLDGDGVGDVLSRSSIDIQVAGDPLPMLHLHYGKRAPAAVPSVPR